MYFENERRKKERGKNDDFQVVRKKKEEARLPSRRLSQGRGEGEKKGARHLSRLRKKGKDITFGGILLHRTGPSAEGKRGRTHRISPMLPEGRKKRGQLASNFSSIAYISRSMASGEFT